MSRLEYTGPQGQLEVQTSGVPLPVEIRTRGLRLVAHGRTHELLDVPAGDLVVSVRLPGDSGLERIVEVPAGGSAPLTVEFSLDLHVREALEARLRSGFSLRGVPSFNVGRIEPASDSGGVIDPARAVALLAFVHQGGHRFRSPWRDAPSNQALPDNSPVFVRCLELDVRGRATSHPVPKITENRDAAGVMIVRLEAERPRVLFFECVGSGARPAVFAIPAAGVDAAKTCELIMNLDGSTPRLFPYFEVREVDLANAYVATEEFQGARSLLSAVAPRRLLSEIANPVAATCAALLFLRIGIIEGWKDVIEDRAQAWPWLPDTAIVAGELQARSGNHQEAFTYFRAATDRSFPIFTGSFSTLLSRLIQYADERSPSLVGETERTEARELVSRLQEWVPIIDYQEPLLTFRSDLLPVSAGAGAESVRVDVAPR